MVQQIPENEIVKKIELDSFSNRMALDMGLKIVTLAESRDQHKHNWIRLKSNGAKQFEESSWSVKNDLEIWKMTLEKTFGFDGKDFLAKGGSFPIFVRNAGMIAIITVSGLHDEEDHTIIIEALKEHYF